MKAATVQKLLLAQGVPFEKAKIVAQRVGTDTPETPTQAIQRTIKSEARKKLVRQRQREIKAWCKVNELPVPTFELRFAWESMRRGWRWDICWPAIDGPGGVAIDVQGGLHNGGAHVRAAGYLNDVAKREAGESLGWKVIYRTWQNLYSEDTIVALRGALEVSTNGR